MAEKLCAQIGQTYEFELPQYEALVRVLVSSFPENTARLRNRGTSLYETLSEKPYVCQGFRCQESRSGSLA